MLTITINLIKLQVLVNVDKDPRAALAIPLSNTVYLQHLSFHFKGTAVQDVSRIPDRKSHLKLKVLTISWIFHFRWDFVEFDFCGAHTHTHLKDKINLASAEVH